MASTETQYTVKVPLNPTSLPTTDKVVIWDESEGRFNLKETSDCQIVYQWNDSSPVTQPPSVGELMMTTQAFSAETPNYVYVGLSLTSYTGNDLTNYFNSFTSASFIVTQQSNPQNFMAFNANLVAVTSDAFILQILTDTFSSSSPPLSGTPNNGDLLCVNISPIGAVSDFGNCENIDSVSINFGTISVGDTQTFTGAEGLTVSTGQTVQLSYIPSPDVFVLGEITNYNEITGVFTLEITYVSNSGYSAGTVDEQDVCYYYFIDNTQFIFKRTLFVDPNGNDGVAGAVAPVGGTLHPPFQTIQAAITYAQDNYVIGEITIHVFAGEYYVSDTNPLVLGHNNLNMNLYLEDGVLIKCQANSPSTNPSLPSYYIKITGNKETSISGHGKINAAGSAGASDFLNVFEIDSVNKANIILKRINASLRDNIGHVFFYASGTSTSNVFFEGEIKASSVNLGILNIRGIEDGNFKTFEFGHQSVINISEIDSAGNNTIPVRMSYQSRVIVRGSWYISTSSAPDAKTLFYYYDDSARVILDGADMYMDFSVSTGIDSKVLMKNMTNPQVKCYFENRERSLTNGVQLSSENISTITYGELQQNVPIFPTILP